MSSRDGCEETGVCDQQQEGSESEIGVYEEVPEGSELRASALRGLSGPHDVSEIHL